MAKVKTFKAIRPNNDYQNIIPCLPYDVFNRSEARNYVKKYPHSFLAIDKPETQFAADFDMYSKECYSKAFEMLNSWIAENSLVKDTDESFYLYELTWNGKSQTGIVGCASVDDYLNGVIKKHENTRLQKEQDRINHVYTCNAQTGPIFLAYKHNDTLKDIIVNVKNEKPLYTFISDNNVENKVWKIYNNRTNVLISKAFDNIKNLYIADGHHRCASAVKVALKKREENPEYTGDESFNWIMSVMFDADELCILDYNRVIKDLNGRSSSQFIEELKQIFDIVGFGKSFIKPGKKGEFALYIDDIWYFLKLKEKYKSKDVVKTLDVSVLQDQVLDNILGINDPTKDSRIDFVGGIRGHVELENRVNNGWACAIAMYPTSMSELLAVADANKLMPPKSTWFEPKLLSGIFVHDISN